MTIIEKTIMLLAMTQDVIIDWMMEDETTDEELVAFCDILQMLGYCMEHLM